MTLGDEQIDEAKAEAAINRAEEQVKSLDHSVDAEEVAQFRLKRRPR